MSKSEGSSSEGVQYGRVDLAVILVVVTVADGQNVQLRHVVRAQHQGQPLVVRDVLPGDSQYSDHNNEALSHLVLGHHNLPGLLVKSLIVPVSVEV